MHSAVLIAAGATLGAAAWLYFRPEEEGAEALEPAPAEEGGGILDNLNDWWQDMTLSNEAALEHPNTRALLRLIRTGEGTADEAGYRRLVGGGSFTSFADHPRQRIWIARIGDYSTAAGAYQFLASTWDSVKRKAGLPDFSPRSQDLAAVQRIRDRGALGQVLAGRIAGALEKLSYEWASLPPWRYARQGTLTLERALNLYAAAGGTIEGPTYA